MYQGLLICKEKKFINHLIRVSLIQVYLFNAYPRKYIFNVLEFETLLKGFTFNSKWNERCLPKSI